MSRWRRAAAELIGTAFLLAAVVGSGISAARLSPSDAGLQLLEAALATGAALAAIILAVGPVSGAHLNPAVSLADRLLGGIDDLDFAAYVVAQVAGGVLGVMAANMMFDLAPVSLATTVRSGSGQWLGEVVATYGLLLIIFGAVRSGGTRAVAFAVGAYIGAAYFFTSSTSFANPAVTVARMLSDTFAGIAPGGVLAFLAAQALGTGLAVGTVRLLYPGIGSAAGDVVVPHRHEGASESAAEPPLG